ncbi:MAG TPA: GNAT family N-acetyltransferase [Actinomycetota bacterium]
MPAYAPPEDLVTERLSLRAFVPSDVDSLFAIYGRDDVVRYLYEDAYTEADARAALDTRMARRRIDAEGDKLAFAVVRRSDDVMVGDCVLVWTSAQHSQAEIGYAMHPDHHGMGYATEAARELLRVAFEELGVHRVIGRTEARNTASARVMEKLGMRREAHLIENEYVKDEWQSELVYAMLQREWRGGSV